MEFWICLVLIGFICMIASIFCNNYQKKYIVYVYLFIVWIIASLRYYIGTDYGMYERLFYDNYRAFNLKAGILEPVYLGIISILYELGFSAQAFFAIYATITMYFIYKGIVYFSDNDNKKVLVGLLIFTYMPHGFWYSMNVVRQFLAMAIAFYLARYVINKEKYKYIIGCIVSMLCHFSAPTFWLMYFIKRKVFSQYFLCISLLIVLLMLFTGENVKLLTTLMYNYGDMLGTFSDKYDTRIFLSNLVPFFSGRRIVFLCLYLCCFYFYRRTTDDKIIFLLNISLVFILIGILMSIQSLNFPLISMLFVRFEVYFLLFYIVLLANWIVDADRKYPYIILYSVLMILALMFLNQLDVISSNQLDNINYEFNFYLIR